MREVKIKGTEQSYPVGKIVCLGRNYLDHIRELGNKVPDRAVIFCKPASSMLPDGGQIELPPYTDDCHHELELAVLIGQSGKNIAEEDALQHVAGYGVALDLTLRDLQSELKDKGLPWEIAKGFDTSCPLSDFVPAAQVDNPNDIRLKLKVNGELRQDGTTAQMMRTVEEIIAELSQYYTLEPGDIILTGTPAGVSRIQSGDQLDGEIEQVGTLSVSVK
ncbi:5-carboxymethyl-2-hydroxymuconate isomerase [Malonomonas rubra DSM 5091]|uniref:5-carboxymethyl-2-hydroxymuconate isomerase n=1 Tax=Malonomonas rubra DSM 5091 TaxID=1122189 RepID=A0A1M6M1I3_MALRU|nr:fumarylacetoacetate hydrolase family protein [Malonomonas rubra]SHJ77256.1 5-carboxymethyl-2-hydroxymuconate isomerase [Malonomonas rubra DSM 5091]